MCYSVTTISESMHLSALLLFPLVLHATGPVEADEALFAVSASADLGSASSIDAGTTTRGPVNAELDTRQYRHVVVIPDVHGDAEAFLVSLYIALEIIDGPIGTGIPPFPLFKQVFDDAIAGRPIPTTPLSAAAPMSVALVQLGDLVDRGPHSIRCMDIILHAERVLGWTVRILQGNHELQRLLARNGAYYMHPREWTGFGSEEAGMAAMQTAVRERLDDVRLLFVRLSAGRDAGDDANSPNTLFVHGGVDVPWLTNVTNLTDVNELNAFFQEEMKDMERASKWNTGFSTPLWMRAYDQLPEHALCGEFLTSALRYFNVARIVIGHMPQSRRTVGSKCNGRILLTDVQVSRWMAREGVDEASNRGGNPAAILMTMLDDGSLGSIEAHYATLDALAKGSQPIFPPPTVDTPGLYRM